MREWTAGVIFVLWDVEHILSATFLSLSYLKLTMAFSFFLSVLKPSSSRPLEYVICLLPMWLHLSRLGLSSSNLAFMLSFECILCPPSLLLSLSPSLPPKLKFEEDSVKTWMLLVSSLEWKYWNTIHLHLEKCLVYFLAFNYKK